ncbi:HD domain-containing protein [Actinoplanes hulinensis]|uniref:HD domain-containing protein n=1 Tax=Actinoplanes hulinensis TaxID=1144547 RepID=A0ABS7AUE1_9ACTN|nr:HD domain-containing protein [Actinoplanes hulinensis]MBW6432404.1 HD domain-containing protein [Actinoplanes hulinensis]
MEDVSWARDLARDLLIDTLPRRWAHSQGVGRKAESIAHLLGDDAEKVVCAAWLHDIGYAPSLVQSGSHALDGARYLRDVTHADDIICRLVAHHSYAVVEAGRRGLAAEMKDEFPAVGGLPAHAMVYSDMTTSPDGDPVEVEKRLQEIAARYAPGSVVADSIAEVGPRIVHSVRVITGLSGFRAG